MLRNTKATSETSLAQLRAKRARPTGSGADDGDSVQRLYILIATRTATYRGGAFTYNES